MKRTHTCGELREDDCGKEVCLQGWVNNTRNLGGLVFVDIRDRYGVTQVIVNPDNSDFDVANDLRKEDVVEVHGVVEKKDKPNAVLATGAIEVKVSTFVVINKSAILPMAVEDETNATDDTRLKYRFLDLRRPIMQSRIALRSKAMFAARRFLNSKQFLEIQTPVLVRATPEGARDYIVPSRVNPGKFYALPQSPQLYKQILMVSGFDRYFQFPICCRDEDLRADRQPEHTQIDLEMTFPTLDDLFETGEGIMKSIFKEALNYELETPFLRIPYYESMDKYGIDKPDIRFDLFLYDLSDVFKESGFDLFKKIVAGNGIVKCINPEKEFSRKEVEALEAIAKRHGAKGLAALKVVEGSLDGGFAKFLSDDEKKKIIEVTGAKNGSTLFFVADKWTVVNDALSRLRNHLGAVLNLYDPKTFKFCWITDFPLFEWNEDSEKWDACHHLFCQPKEECIGLLDSDPGKVLCTQYDMVLNGVELASGSLRITDPDLQKKIMKTIGLTEDEAENKFGFLLEAFRYGAPPHGGMGIGFDRVVALACGLTDIREVIAFPKNKNAHCPMDGSPADVGDDQLKELHIASTFKGD